jgi:hypothetical protein
MLMSARLPIASEPTVHLYRRYTCTASQPQRLTTNSLRRPVKLESTLPENAQQAHTAELHTCRRSCGLVYRRDAYSCPGDEFFSPVLEKIHHLWPQSRQKETAEQMPNLSKAILSVRPERWLV